MEKKVLDGDAHPVNDALGYRLEEVGKYTTVTNLYSGGLFFTVMSPAAWNSLPSDVQKIIDQLSGKWAIDFVSAPWDKAEVAGFKKMETLAGHEMIYLSEEESKRWQQALRPLWDAKVAELEGKGMPGKKMLDEVLKAIQEYK